MFPAVFLNDHFYVAARRVARPLFDHLRLLSDSFVTPLEARVRKARRRRGRSTKHALPHFGSPNRAPAPADHRVWLPRCSPMDWCGLGRLDTL